MARTLNVRDRKVLIEDILVKSTPTPGLSRDALSLAIDHLRDQQLLLLSDDIHKLLGSLSTDSKSITDELHFTHA